MQYGRHRQSFTIRAVAVDGAIVNEAFAVEGSAERLTAVDARAVKYLTRLLGGGKTLVEFQPYGVQDEAPLQWPATTGYPTSAASYLEWTIRVKPMGWEQVTVPAGSFRALRVEVAGSRGSDPDPFWQPKQAGRFVHTIWYAPEARRYVKARHQTWSMTASPFGDELIELLEYRAN